MCLSEAAAEAVALAAVVVAMVPAEMVGPAGSVAPGSAALVVQTLVAAVAVTALL